MDTWTSIQRINYMSLTAHFIDKDLKMNKKILNFCPIFSHRGVTFLAVPISTVASESAFSMEGRVPVQFKSSLIPKNMEAHLCTQDWLFGSSSRVNIAEDLEELEKYEEGIFLFSKALLLNFNCVYGNFVLSNCN
ncbi:Dimer_Tnp_hAT domain-containing protein [Cephalotus follicularis]|uniref:Dimer_Tnp_hAT domain-containing protein n=1 Tax=Cephalotus follicularis TaxID=3775 RepID=A0A1Q3B5E4_CEPFO|nr:Dimer_Tnp_hAT domain-containing protein [Cephalotus follicularis]